MVLRILLLGITTLYLAGCMNQNVQPDKTTSEEPLFEQTSDQNESKSNNDIANHLANIASEVPDVENAVAIVAGPYAVVGIDVDEKIDRQRVGTIKFSVNEALRDDPYGKTAIVVADADTMERIRNMRERMQNGEPIQGVVDELADIVGRLMPTFPVEEHRNEDIEQEDGTIMEDRQGNNELHDRNNQEFDEDTRDNSQSEESSHKEKETKSR